MTKNVTAETHHLAQLNIGRLRYEIGDPRMADFVGNLARVNALADRAEGFVWRLQDDGGNATSFRPYDDPRIAINMSVWKSVEALERYVWQTVHKRFYGRRDEWFEKFEGLYFVMWWVPAGHCPTIQEAIERLDICNATGRPTTPSAGRACRPRSCGRRRGVREEKRMAVTPSWLTDEAIERTQALGDEMAKLLLRRNRQKKINPNAKVKPGRRLLKMLAELKAHEPGSGRGKR